MGLEVITGGATRRKSYHRRRLEDPELRTCHVCETDMGTATSTFLECSQDLFLKPGEHRPHGSTRGWLCAHCLSRGKVTVIFH